MRTLPFTRSLLLTIFMLAVPAISSAGILLSVQIAPPPLPVYAQPVCPGDGYIWTPGYWAYGDDGFFWVPGTWVLPPDPGLLWTPGYWGWGDGAYVFHEGYWGPQVGFYGGIDYGFGYIGVGYEGGYWRSGAFFYNRAFNHIDHVRNEYNKTVNVHHNYVSYDGGEGGINARPNREEEAAARDRHIPPSSAQVQHRQAASGNRQLYESANHGKPPIAATAKPGDFSHSVVKAKAAANSYRPATARQVAAPARNGAPERSATPVHPNDLPKMERSAPTATGNAKQDQKYQQQQQKLFAKQDQERQKLQQKQEQEHQKFAQSKPNPQRQQQMEQRHQQQTQQLQQRHTTQMQHLQSRQPQPRPAPKKR